MSKVEELANEVRNVMQSQIAGEISEEDSARLIILLQIEIISELTNTVKCMRKEAA